MKTIKVELKANCPYGKIGDVIEVDENTSKAYGEAMVKTTAKLTDGVDSIASDVETKEVKEGKEVKTKQTKEVKNNETK